MGSGYSCLALHGGIDQQDRDSNIKDFKEGNVRLLIATSVAARGLDVKQLNLVREKKRGEEREKQKKID